MRGQLLILLTNVWAVPTSWGSLYVKTEMRIDAESAGLSAITYLS